MTWFQALQLARELLTVIIPIIGEVLGSGHKQVEPGVLPESLREKIIRLADAVKERQ